jgi:hypothetical protein
LRREQDEAVIVFNRRFHNFYLNMPMEIQPIEVDAMVQYTIAQHPDLVLFLKREVHHHCNICSLMQRRLRTTSELVEGS